MVDQSSPDTKTLLERINDWLREPDYAEDFSLDEMIDWIERRPISAVATLTARSSAGNARLTELAQALVAIQEDMPSEDVRNCLGEAAHYLEKFATLGVAQPQQEIVGYQRRNIGPDGKPLSGWYHADDEPTLENMKFDGYLSYEYRPLHPGTPLPSTQHQATTCERCSGTGHEPSCDGACFHCRGKGLVNVSPFSSPQSEPGK